MKGMLEKFEREDLPNKGLRILSDSLGINQVKEIMLTCPGQTFHIPKSFYKQSDLNYITKHIDDDPKDIAYKLGCSLRTVQRKVLAIRTAPKKDC